MIFKEVLFYPTAEMEDDWLKNAILFWDEINTVVPTLSEKTFKREVSNALSDKGILKSILLKPENNFIPSITKDSLNYLNTNEGFQLLTQGLGLHAVLQKEKLSKAAAQFFELYTESIDYKNNSLSGSVFSGEDQFQEGYNFLNFCRTILAGKLAEERSISLLTDDPMASNLIDKIKLDNQVAINGADMDSFSTSNSDEINLSQGLLTNLIINSIRVSNRTSVTSLLNFKREYINELNYFKRNIEKIINCVAKNIPFEVLIKQVNEIYSKEFLPTFTDLKKALDAYGIKWENKSFMKISAITTSTTALPTALGGPALPYALLATPDISLITSVVSYNANKKEKLKMNPYSYLLKLDNHI